MNDERRPQAPSESATTETIVPHDDDNRAGDADRRRQRIKLLLETMIQNRGKILDLITEASENHDHIALGFKSWADYVRTEYAGLLARLTVEDRRETVLILSRTGLSTRAIAPIVETDHSTIVRDLHLQSGGADAPPAIADKIRDDPAPKCTVVGIDGKVYRAPKPKPRRASFPDAYRYAVDDLDKVVRRIERLHADDRFLGHREDSSSVVAIF